MPGREPMRQGKKNPPPIGLRVERAPLLKKAGAALGLASRIRAFAENIPQAAFGRIYFLLWCLVLFSSLRCLCLRIFLRRFFITLPISSSLVCPSHKIHEKSFIPDPAFPSKKNQPFSFKFPCRLPPGVIKNVAPPYPLPDLGAPCFINQR